MNTNFHTESRMREIRTYGSMRGRAYPTRGVPPYSTPSESAWRRAEDAKLLDVRVFDTKETKAVYEKQTAAAEKNGVSNCPLCAVGHAANRTRIYKFAEMDADHVTAWTKGGATDIRNCQMLCKTHNRAKGNR